MEELKAMKDESGSDEKGKIKIRVLVLSKEEFRKAKNDPSFLSTGAWKMDQAHELCITDSFGKANRLMLAALEKRGFDPKREIVIAVVKHMSIINGWMPFSKWPQMFQVNPKKVVIEASI